MSLIFRLATEEDSLRLSVLLKQVYMDTYGLEGVSTEFAHFITENFSVENVKAAIHSDKTIIWLAVYKNNLVGTLQIVLDKACPLKDIVAPEINKLYILNRFSGKGIGRELMKRGEESLRKIRQNQVWLWVLESNERACSFYAQQDYKCIGNAPLQLEENLYDNKVMLKEL